MVFRYFLSNYLVDSQKVRIFVTTTKTANYIAYEKTSINNRFERLRHNGYGSIPPLSLSAGERADDLLGRLTLEEKVSLMMDTSPAIERLGIPQFQWWNEALHGIGRNGFATVFPITMGMAASWRSPTRHRAQWFCHRLSYHDGHGSLMG